MGEYMPTSAPTRAQTWFLQPPRVSLGCCKTRKPNNSERRILQSELIRWQQQNTPAVDHAVAFQQCYRLLRQPTEPHQTSQRRYGNIENGLNIPPADLSRYKTWRRSNCQRQTSTICPQDHSRSVVTSRTVLRSINSHPQDTYTLERSIIALGEARLPRCNNAYTRAARGQPSQGEQKKRLRYLFETVRPRAHRARRQHTFAK